MTTTNIDPLFTLNYEKLKDIILYTPPYSECRKEYLDKLSNLKLIESYECIDDTNIYNLVFDDILCFKVYCDIGTDVVKQVDITYIIKTEEEIVLDICLFFIELFLANIDERFNDEDDERNIEGKFKKNMKSFIDHVETESGNYKDIAMMFQLANDNKVRYSFHNDESDGNINMTVSFIK